MSERYGKLFSSPENLYAESSPVIIAAGALLKDNRTGKILAQLKFQNIAPKKIKALTVCIQPLDKVDNPLGDSVTYQYLDLSAERDSEFGQKTPIMLPNVATRSFTVSVTEVIFEDNTIWYWDRRPWETLAGTQALSSLRDSELEKQFRLEYGENCANLLLEQKDLWHCVCGAENRQDEPNCHTCRRSHANLKAIDMDSLQARKTERVAKEKADAEAARLEAEKRAEAERLEAEKQAIVFRKHRKKIGIVAFCIVIVALAIAILPAISDYRSAVSLMESGQYEEAIAAFEAMDGYLDSADLISECQYLSAVVLMESGQYEEAIAAFEAMDGYKDSPEQITACNAAIIESKYQYAMTLMELEKYEAAIAEFEAMDGYKDSTEQIFSCESAITESKYQNAIILMASEQYEDAITEFEALGGYKDSAEQIIACETAITERKYQCAMILMETGEKTEAAILFGSIDYEDSSVLSKKLWDKLAIREYITATGFHTIALKSDGTVVAVGDTHNGECNVSHWSDIIAISASDSHTVGLKSDGTVVAVGCNDDGQCDVSDWTNIVAISSSSHHTVGLKSDGTAVAVGRNDDGQCDVSDWTDIVAISSGYDNTVGLKSNGTVLAVGYNQWEQCNVSSWRNIVAIFSGHSHTVGLKSDGTVVAVGYNYDERRDVSNWTDIKVP